MYESHAMYVVGGARGGDDYEGCRVIFSSLGGGGGGKEAKKNAGSFAVWLALSRAVWVGGGRACDVWLAVINP